jgi:hypothetical protein
MLPPIDYDLDVEGDVILTLENPNEPFAVWVDEGEPWEVPPSPPHVLDDQVIRSFRRIDPAWKKVKAKARKSKRFGLETAFSQVGLDDGFQDEASPDFLPVDAPIEEPAPLDFQEAPLQEEEPETAEVPETTEGLEVPVDLSNLSVEEALDVSKRVGSEETGSEDNDGNGNEASRIRFRLSSRHLISASPYFRRMLTGPWKENASRADRLYKVTASDWSEDAFKLLMDIVHGNSQNVPRSINLELLAKIAVMVDYYKCYDVVKFYSDTWIEGLGNAMKVTNYSRDFVLVLFVSCVFFQRATCRN